jgi:hypothetical protein
MKTLVKYHSNLVVEKIGPNDFDLISGPGVNDNWTKLEGTIFLSSTYVDLAGLAMDEETVYPEAITIQESGLGNAIAGAAGDSIVTMDIVSSVAIDMAAEYGNILLNGVGFPHGAGDFQHIQYVRTERHTLDLDTGAVFPFKAESNQAGSMAPTASDRLYVYRFVFVYDASTTVSSIKRQAGRVVMAVNTKKEQEYQYLMRLKRSYDLQQTFDRD